jgi:hypothetical protein
MRTMHISIIVLSICSIILAAFVCPPIVLVSALASGYMLQRSIKELKDMPR